MASKYENLVFEGRWKYKKVLKGKYVFENIYNKQEVVLSGVQIYNVINGKDTLSKIISRKLFKEKGTTVPVDNHTCTRWQNNKRKYAKRRF